MEAAVQRDPTNAALWYELGVLLVLVLMRMHHMWWRRGDIRRAVYLLLLGFLRPVVAYGIRASRLRVLGRTRIPMWNGEMRLLLWVR